MKHLIVSLALLTTAVPAFASTSIDDSRGKSDGIVEILITGGKGSQAEKLYNSLTAVAEQPDDAMGGRHGTAKQAKAIDCSVEDDKFVHSFYSCTIKVSTAGDSLEPWK